MKRKSSKGISKADLDALYAHIGGAESWVTLEEARLIADAIPEMLSRVCTRAETSDGSDDVRVDPIHVVRH